MYKDREETLEVAKASIVTACKEYVEGKIDDDGVRRVLAEIPVYLWTDPSDSVTMIQVLVEDEDMYDISLERNVCFAKFVYGFLPTAFWGSKESVIRVVELIVDDLIAWCSFAAFHDFSDVLQFVPDGIRQDRWFTLSLIEMIAEREGSIDWSGRFDSILPESFLNDKDNLLAAVMFIMRAKQSNAADFALVPTSAWQHSDIIFWILRNFQDEYESDRYLFTMYPVFRGSKREYLETFLTFIPNKFKSDKGFVMEFMDYSYFSDEFGVLYDWIDKGLWYDKKIVLKVLESDVTAVVYVPQELLTDEEVKKYIDENIDFEWDLSGVPAEKIPQWIKEYGVEES